MSLQYLTTTVTCLALAFTRSCSLTLVVLSAFPLLALVQHVFQRLASSLLAIERQQSGVAATLVDRAITAISTVKAFNAQLHEETSLNRVLKRLDSAGIRLNAVFGLSCGLSQF